MRAFAGGNAALPAPVPRCFWPGEGWRKSMGVIRFQVHPPRRVTPETAHRAYFTAPDRSLWRSRVRLTDDGLVLERTQSDSGYFHIPWLVDGHGEVALST